MSASPPTGRKGHSAAYVERMDLAGLGWKRSDAYSISGSDEAVYGAHVTMSGPKAECGHLSLNFTPLEDA